MPALSAPDIAEGNVPTALNSQLLSERPVLTADQLSNLQLEQHESSTIPSAPVDPDVNVVIQQPRTNENIQVEGDGEEEETEDSIMTVEQALGAGLHGANGFSLKFDEQLAICCPTLSLTSSSAFGEFVLRVGAAEFTTTSKSGCYCCFAPRSSSWQTITILKGGLEMMSFVYRPQIWCLGGKKERLADIYIPQRNRRIGWIKYEDKYENGALLVDSVTKTPFVMKKIKSESEAMVIYTNFGVPAALAQATRGWRRRGFVTWTEFEFKYTPLVTSSSASVKGVMMAAFILWVHTNRERRVRNRILFTVVMIFIGLTIGFGLGFLDDSKKSTH